MQQEIIHPGQLLNESGSLEQAGYARSPLLQYRRSNIRAGHIKEWDSYLIVNSRFALTLTIADCGCTQLGSISFFDFEAQSQHTKNVRRWPSLFGTGLPDTSEKGNAAISGKGYGLLFENDGTARRLSCHLDDFYGGKPLDAFILLTDEPEESVVVAAPFPKEPKAFLYCRKIHGMWAEGKVTYDEKEYCFPPEDSFGTLNWGRGAWTRKNTGYWGGGSGLVEGRLFSFNIGCTLGGDSAASENMLFYNGKGHKISNVAFHVPKKDGHDDFRSPWKTASGDGRFEVDFQPIPVHIRTGGSGKQHLLFGRYSGKAVLDDGPEIIVKNFMGFIEKFRG